jgi:hypothetical protein
MPSRWNESGRAVSVKQMSRADRNRLSQAIKYTSIARSASAVAGKSKAALATVKRPEATGNISRPR